MTRFTRWPSIYVLDLDDNVTVRNLYIFFSKFDGAGLLLRVEISDDSKVGRFAQITFYNREDADMAAKNRQSALLLERPIRIVGSHPNPSAIEYITDTAIVENLDDSVTALTLKAVFSEFAEIRNCWVERDSSGKSKGVRFVEFIHIENCQCAVRWLNGTLCLGKQIHVRSFFLGPRTEVSQDTSKYKVLKSDSEPATEDDPKKIRKFGLVTRVAVFGKSKDDYTVLNLEKSEHAAECVKYLNGKVLDDVHWCFEEALKKRDHEHDGLIAEHAFKTPWFIFYVKSLDKNIDGDKLRELSTSFSGISSYEVMQDDEDGFGFGKGCGSAIFSTLEESSPTLYGINEKMVVSKHLYVALACEKKVRTEPLKGNFLQMTLKVTEEKCAATDSEEEALEVYMEKVSHVVQASHHTDQLASPSLRYSLVS